MRILQTILSWVRKSSPSSPSIPTQPLPDAVVYTIGGGWGNKIGWVQRGEKIVGWKLRRPRVGDLLVDVNSCDDRTRYYIITSVRLLLDPPDMFWADVVFYKYVPEFR